jgi:hypothetical protein
MTISNTSESAILKLIFQAVAWTDYAQNHGTTPQTNITTALHTADPTDTGTSTSSEATYTSYARVDRLRDATNWPETSGSISPSSNIDFSAGTGGAGTVNFFSTCHTGSAGSSQPILWSGTVVPNIVTGSGVTPRLTTASTITLD